MARISHRKLIQMVEGLEPRVRDAFLQAIAEVRGEAAIGLLAELIEAGRVDGVMDLLGLNDARFSPMHEMLRTVYAAGGEEGASELPAMRADPYAMQAAAGFRPARRLGKLLVRFDMRNPRAEEWLRTESGRLISGVLEDQRILIRELLAEGAARGLNPRTTALDLVGRTGATGRRTGGVVGLTSAQAGYVANARRELGSGDPAVMARYFGRERRDRRLDGIVRRAIAARRPVAAADIAKITGRYADRLLQLRGETIARTETLPAFNAARDEAYLQAIDTGGLRPENVIGEWSAVGDRRTRDTHAAMQGQERRLGQPFESPSGAQMLFPGDTSLGAGPEEIVNCRCAKLYRIDMIAETMQRGR